MTQRAAKLCRCGDVIFEAGCQRCHRISSPEIRPNAGDRGYDHRWQQFRKQYIKTRVMSCRYHCDDCGQPFLPKHGSPELHHKIKVRHNRALMYEPSNLMMLHKHCHAARTARGE